MKRNSGRGRPEGIWVVDRIEGTVAVLVRDEDAPTEDGHLVDARREDARRGNAGREGGSQLDGRQEDVPVTLLPAGIREGVVLRVPEPGGSPAWAHAVVDEELHEARLREAEEVLERLRRRDPGGDVAL